MPEAADDDHLGIRLLDLATGQMTILDAGAGSWQVAFSPDGGELAVTTSDALGDSVIRPTGLVDPAAVAG
jgi:hypothetical protein